MSRRIRFIALTLALSTLLAVAAQAAPTRIPARESVARAGLFTGLWDRLASYLKAATLGAPAVKGSLGKSADDTSHLDPNGSH